MTAKLCDKPADNIETMCVNDNDIMNSVSDDRDLDIANMSDFSDDEDGISAGSQPRTQAGCVLDSSFNETLSLCNRPVAITVTARDDRDLPDPNDREYWTKFRLLTKQAFLLDDDCLSDSNFPEAVKDVVKRSRLTMMALDEYDAPQFDQQTNEQTPDGSDEEDNRDLDDSDDEYGYTDYWPIRHTESGIELSVSIDIEANVSPMSQDPVCPEHSKQNTVSVYMDTQVLVKKFAQKRTFYCLGVCVLTDRFKEPGLCWCWRCVDRLVWGYRVSCLMASVNANRFILIDVFTKESRVYAMGLGLIGDPVRLCDAMRVYLQMKGKFNSGLDNVMVMHKDPVVNTHPLRGEDNRWLGWTRAPVYSRPIRVWGRFGCLDSPVCGADWSVVRSVGVRPVWKDIRNEYIGDEFSQCQSSDAAPLTETRDLQTLLHINRNCATELYLIWTLCATVRVRICVEIVTKCGGDLSASRTMDGAALAHDRSGVTFTAELCVPWDAPEAVIDIDSPELVRLGSLPDKVGLFGRRTEVAVSRIIAGRDNRSVRFLVPDGRLVDCGYHDVTVVDMDEEREPMVVMQDMKRLGELWPAEVFDHMRYHQQDLELLRKSAKKTYSQTLPMLCRFCGKVICVDMYRHVARLHLDLVQLWRCPIAWCTTWKGSPQDCLEHVRSGHDARWVSKTASIEKCAPPWTVRRQVWTDSLRVDSSGISTDMLLFSEVGMPLTQHYRVYKGGLPHAVFRSDYLTRIRSLLPSPEGDDTSLQTGSVSTPKSVRRQHRVTQPKRLFAEAAGEGPLLTEQNPAEMAGETVIDCRPPMLPVSILLGGLSPARIAGARNCVQTIEPEETGQSIMDMDTNEISIARIIGFDWKDTGTDVEDELPTPASSPAQIAVPAIPPVGTADPFGRGEGFDMELAKVMCDVSVLPSLVSPIQE